MRRYGKIAALLLAAALLAGTAGACTNSNKASSQTTAAQNGTAASTAAPAADGTYDFYIFNTKGENADALQAAVHAYSAKTGQNIKVFSLGSGTNASDALNTEMNSENMPTIFSIMNIQELKTWTEGGFALDLSKATNSDF